MDKADWKKETTFLTIAYRLLECGDKIPVLTAGTDYTFIEKDLEEMCGLGLLAINVDTAEWEITDKGRELRKKMLAVYDQSLKFEVFGTVHLAGPELEKEITDEDGGVLDHHWDPRFDPEAIEEGKDFGTEDMRIAMMTYLADQMRDKLEAGLDPHRIVFMQMLAEGKLKSPDIWFALKLGEIHQEIEEIVKSQYLWTDVADTEDEAIAVMETLYTAGMLEQRKRDGQMCSGCEILLALFVMNEPDLNECPNPECGASFSPPQPEPGSNEYECPACQHTVYGSDRQCGGCGALLDFGLPPGSITQETTEETVVEEDDYDELVWGGYYDYVPYGYYDPWDPWVDVAAFGVCCAILW